MISTAPAPRRRFARALSAAAAIATLTLLAAGCSAQDNGNQAKASDEAAQEISGTLTVSAAASLQPAFEQLTQDFARAHPGVTFETLSFDGSSVLATQIIGGAPVDVFASADAKNMKKVQDAGLVAGAPTPFAKSLLQIAVAPGNPLGIHTLADLAKTPGGKTPTVVLCAAEVPCGAASQTLLTRDGVSLKPASEEQNVTAVLTKVQAGEADAGLVYRSDVLRSAGKVEGIAIEGASEAAGLYLIAPLKDAKSPEAARAFTEFLTSQHAQEVLNQLGFDQA
ncbi:molybdate ABC transporter substrate-binding protein [Leucobacter sp. CSA2]|uniref:Molybdate ABC transporter substrate-binding protein n=1 Tax=Leucobacter edaphi TaxID=2796472 RepID=A0A934QCN0_9MICO|nr:molybdate ABC transporter substrate-binding protein [Leucobacter edaphi]MBK0420822.1 molybdate ABC transporter substrate-binding protein [Leucobacter edaphi]